MLLVVLAIECSTQTVCFELPQYNLQVFVLSITTLMSHLAVTYKDYALVFPLSLDCLMMYTCQKTRL